MKNIRYVLLAVFAMILIYGCENGDTEFRNFFNDHEITYPGAVSNVISTPGSLRVELKWKGSPDPSIVKYIIYWNSRADSQVVNLTGKSDSIRTTINNLNEYVYSFTIFAVDGKGNRSIPLEVNNVKVFGPAFNKGLLNRKFDVNRPYTIDKNGALTLYFLSPDTNNVTNVKTLISYTNKQGAIVEKSLSPDQSSITINDYKAETPVQFKSAYIPGKVSIDTFLVAEYSSFPQIDPYYEIDKSSFRALVLPNEVRPDFGTTFEKLWDGSNGPQGYPNIFHSNSVDLPHFFTFDLGQVYNSLGKMEETGRDCCHNPDQFEVWGIADISNANTTLAGNDPGWKNQMTTKGWTLLADVSRNDDGRAAYKFNLIDNAPPVRYIRIRVKHTSNGNTNTSNISEITLWNKL